MFTKNTNNTDRIIRVVLFVVLVAAGLAMNSIIPPIIGAVLLATALVGFCPIYRIFGISTCRIPQA